MRTILSIIFSLISFQLLMAQQDFRPGYIINLQGDTINGNVDYRNWNYCPDFFHFNPSNTSAIMVCKPDSVLKVSVMNEVYVPAEVEVEFSKTDIDQLDDYNGLNLEKRKIFLLTLLEGPKSLFMYKDKYGLTNYYIRNNNQYELLVYKKYLAMSSGSDVIRENNKFIGQLLVYLGDCSDIQSDIQRTKYDRFSLEKRFNEYYKKCSDFQPKHITPIESDRFVFGLLAGVSHTKINFDGMDHFLTRMDFPASIDIAFGGNMEVIFNRTRNRWSLNTELIYSTYSTKAEESTYFDDKTVNFRFDHFTLKTLFRYKRKAGPIDMFLNFGITNGILVYQQNEVFIHNTFNNQNSVSQALTFPRRWEVGYEAGVGVMYGHFSLEYRYALANGTSSFINFSSWTNKSFFMLGYRF